MSRLPSDETEQIPIPGYSAAELTAAAQQSMKVEFGASSHVGKVRAKNQDHFSIVRIARSLDVVSSNIPRFEIPEKVEEFAYGMVAADGMGGMAGGERASILAIQTGIRLVLEAPKWALRIDEQEARQLVDRMRVYFQQVDATLIRETLYDPSLTGMGTTLTVAYSVGSHAFVAHAGDSRAYLLRDGNFRQLTRDHTLAQSLADAGKIPSESVGAHSARHVLVNFAGGPRRGIEPEIGTLELMDGDRLLLCTDGLTGMVTDPEIVAVLNKHDDPKLAAQALIERALELGDRDNVTVLIARYQVTS
jgi:serine/threonine protein phosphatase PrpC